MNEEQIEKFYKIIKDSGEFDEEYYIKTYFDESNINEDPITHFITKGVRKLYNPSPNFNTDFYLQNNVDIINHLKKVGFDNFNPLVHYIQYGKNEHRETQRSKLFFNVTSQDLIKNSDIIMNRLIFLEERLEKQSKELDDINELLNILFLNFNVKASGILRLEQLLSLELFNLFDKFCRKNELEYWMDFGTLLGAIRHEGYIPWDDDMDIGMLRKDFEKFLEHFMDDISKNPFLKENITLDYHAFDENWKADPKFLHLFPQVRFKNPQAKIDIFIFDYVERNDTFRAEYKNIKKQFIDDVTHERSSVNDALNKYNSILKVTENKTNYIVDSIDSYPSYRVLKHEDIFPIKPMKFEDYVFSCPNNPHNYLVEYYGANYMHIPKSIECHDRVEFIKSQFESEKDAESSLKKAILDLKENIEKLYG